MKSAPAAACVLLLLLVAGCSQRLPLTPHQAEVGVECRQAVDRAYNAQNRADLTRRDERDSAYSGNYDVGIASRGLGAEFGRGQDIDACERANGASGDAAPGTGPAFNPSATSGGASP